MSTSNVQSPSESVPSLTSNDGVFSVDAHDSAMNVISIAEARSRFGKAGTSSQGVIAVMRHFLGAVGIEFWWSQAAHAADLVRLRTIVAANDNTSTQNGTDN